ncbi:hypothetical protein FH972_023602 [Carpinus fangiana]|uniref:SUN domain-containing protein n=1 Tax=Carpinus fangiana TaxID=176857 RepID=A0A5N6KW55_9ROSI|nr:hypothetical protein FH972_023602 [Carpinus fangiana]
MDNGSRGQMTWNGASIAGVAAFLAVGDECQAITSSDNASEISRITAHPDSPPTDVAIGDSKSTNTVATPATPEPLVLAGVHPTQASETEEEESLLDNAKFLSFEDWKKQNIAEKGLPDNLGQGKDHSSEGRERRRPGINNALEGLGEDAEIEIDFGFGHREPTTQPGQPARTTPDSVAADGATQVPKKRNKDAGKTCKERTNYASFDCAANILKTNPKCKSSSSVLVENKDSYMLNECSQDNKFLIVELCDGVLIDTLVLANFEFFSSMFRHFKISVSDRYPVKPDKWIDLGTFEARNSRDIQPFLIENPQIFARYLRVEFLTHYGSEYYCPLSLIRVHGITMFEQYRMSVSGDTDDHDGEEEVHVPPSTLPVPTPLPVAAIKNIAHEDYVLAGSPSLKISNESVSPTSSVCAAGSLMAIPTPASLATCDPVPVTSAPTPSEIPSTAIGDASGAATGATVEKYIESQSLILREAFSKVEKRNVATTSRFLEVLNSTVLAELSRVKTEYEQIWQSTVLELASQRDEGRRERDLLGERVRLLADEMIAQKRLMAAQAILLLLCLGIVVFAKFGTAGVDSSLVQGMQELVMMRSRRTAPGQDHKRKGHQAFPSVGRRWPWESPWASPPRSRDITRPQTAVGHNHANSMELERGLLESGSPLESSSPEPGSPILALENSGSESDEMARNHAPHIRSSSETEINDDRVDGQELSHDDVTTTKGNGAAVGLGLKYIPRPDHDDTRLVGTRSAPTTPRATGAKVDLGASVEP